MNQWNEIGYEPLIKKNTEKVKVMVGVGQVLYFQ